MKDEESCNYAIHSTFDLPCQYSSSNSFSKNFLLQSFYVNFIVPWAPTEAPNRPNCKENQPVCDMFLIEYEGVRSLFLFNFRGMWLLTSPPMWSIHIVKALNSYYNNISTWATQQCVCCNSDFFKPWNNDLLSFFNKFARSALLKSAHWSHICT